MYTNCSQFNMLDMGSSMNYQNFLGGGFGMGCNGYNIGGMLGGCNFFQNCDGSYDYDAMAQVSIGNTLINGFFAYLSSARVAKQAKKAASPEARLETLETKQAEKQSEVDAETKAFNNASKAYTEAKSAYKTNQDKINAYTPELQQLVEQYKAWQDSKEDPKPPAPCSESDFKAADLKRIEA